MEQLKEFIHSYIVMKKFLDPKLMHRIDEHAHCLMFRDNTGKVVLEIHRVYKTEMHVVFRFHEHEKEVFDKVLELIQDTKSDDLLSWWKSKSDKTLIGFKYRGEKKRQCTRFMRSLIK